MHNFYAFSLSWILGKMRSGLGTAKSGPQYGALTFVIVLRQYARAALEGRFSCCKDAGENHWRYGCTGIAVSQMFICAHLITQ